ncbi:MAG: hypothetical protein Q7J30_01260 [Candidatus Azambacteria bacterium]|nr:hypothetical protein [Candidatus Azambacteria bacterium]
MNKERGLKKEIIFGLVVMIAWFFIVFAFRFFYHDKFPFGLSSIILIGLSLFFVNILGWVLGKASTSKDERIKKIGNILIIIFCVSVTIYFLSYGISTLIKKY